MAGKMDSREMENLEHARLFWSRLVSSYPGPDKEIERFTHLWRIVDLADFARLSPVTEPKSRVFSCISLAVSENGDEMRGASSKLRTTMRFNQFNNDPKSTPYKILKDVWAPKGAGAFDGQTSRLKQLLQKEYEEKELPKLEKLEPHEFESCAEQVVYEKLSRLGNTPKYLYTVQKSARNIKAEYDVLKYQVKVVHRCKNCMLANEHLGHVVTDQEGLKDLWVPVVTPSVLRFFSYSIRACSPKSLQKAHGYCMAAPTSFWNQRGGQLHHAFKIGAERY
ncbi:hypothetical protein O6H91_13G032900 [Diphasiastrum complanatum]|uniref:Uncharacterized protein n=1 Tax=Diphasiastrum complanatum TaxID=34168 RepID=A0ACC2BTK9_DIPCM|nr:hypothetical protein O6H91_13G032900 [Diphasiastrum complanatum]